MLSALKRYILPVIFALLLAASPGAGAHAQNNKAKGKKSAVAAPKGSASRKVTKKAEAPKNESVNDVKKQQGAVQKEIADTRTKIKENEQAVKKGLADLNTLQGEIAEGKKKLDDASRQVRDLTVKISEVEGNISKEEKELQKLRDEYLKAVKKMRVKRKSASTLSFLFSSRNFSEAMRRMRYLKEFSVWRGRQSEEIGKKVTLLKQQREVLAKAKSDKDVALQTQSRLQAQLSNQYKEQDAMVVKLKANGDALRSYLAQKQAEANTLKNRVSALIAEEQRREAERKAKEEAARRAEAERKAQLAREEAARKAEAEAKAKREREIAAAETKAKEEAASKKKAANAKDSSKATAKKETKKDIKKEKQAKEESRKKKEEKSSSSSYAEARKRKPRGSKEEPGVEKSVPAVNKGEDLAKPAQKNTDSGGGGFASMKGALPRPVSGSFRITSHFGRHALPDLPNVMYDNPGIDADVSAGASAQAVYAGKVSGVYVVPGYSTVVIVNHGNYYTVYGNIQHASVKVGDTVKQGHNLGKLSPSDNDSGSSAIHFEVWHNRDKMNPSEWIR
ncbi:MAG: peptidoglycan DD-metalloendopeptidase family protein [Muribaculaceae bacterium]|nr:peptidoglycan DD-metalloendopeptidase family protein [Muribaculaceae bacterium]